MREIQVLCYDPIWAEEFSRLRAFLESIMGETALAIEHVGSTSVEGLAAKPILDVDIVVRRENWEEACRKLQQAGYRDEGNGGIPDREIFFREDPLFFPYHLYLCPEDSQELRRHLLFRDWLRSHPKDRKAYGKIKKEAAALYPHDIDGYLEYKGRLIQEIYKKCGLEEKG